jgi:hypothetical protein
MRFGEKTLTNAARNQGEHPEKSMPGGQPFHEELPRKEINRAKE